MTHRSEHSESYKPIEADISLAHASDESISYDQNRFFAQVPRVLARPLIIVICFLPGGYGSAVCTSYMTTDVTHLKIQHLELN